MRPADKLRSMDYRTIRMAPKGDQGEESPLLAGEIELDEQEARAIGSLLEKQMTTPDYYPMTLNSLTAACNQKSSRRPVVSYTEGEVQEALDRLKEKGLVHRITGADSRVPRFRHVFHDALRLNQPQGAAMCVLMLRGPQTVGEIRQRTNRMYDFASLAEVEETLEELIRKQPRALVARLARAPGTKDARYAQLLSGEPPDVEEWSASSDAARSSSSGDERIGELEQRIADLEGKVDSLQEAFERFKQQF